MGITELTVAVWPWLLTMLGFLVLVTYWPAIVHLAAQDYRLLNWISVCQMSGQLPPGRSLMPQCINRVHAGGAAGRKVAEQHADASREQE